MKAIQITTKFSGGPQEVVLKWGLYANKQNALQLIGDMGEPVMTASVCMSDESIEPNQIFIKDWSENQGILAELIHNGIVEDTYVRVPAGYTQAALCNILVEME